MDYESKFYGKLKGAIITEKYDSGELESVKFHKLNRIIINGNEYIPSYTLDSVRKKDIPSLLFYKSGKIKSINLEEGINVSVLDKTFNIEKAVFYESGEIKRLFPLNGRLSAAWSEEDEYNLSKEYDFDFNFAKFKAKVISIKFYKSGIIKSVTLWPKDRIKITYKDKQIPIRTGFSLYEDGALESIEPSSKIKVHTPIGDIEAYNKNAVSIHGESNSLKFNKDGSVKALITSSNIIKIIDKNGEEHIYSPEEDYLYVNSLVKDLITVSLVFSDGKVIINGNDEFNYKDNKFLIEEFKETTINIF